MSVVFITAKPVSRTVSTAVGELTHLSSAESMVVLLPGPRHRKIAQLRHGHAAKWKRV